MLAYWYHICVTSYFQSPKRSKVPLLYSAVFNIQRPMAITQWLQFKEHCLNKDTGKAQKCYLVEVSPDGNIKQRGEVPLPQTLTENKLYVFRKNIKSFVSDKLFSKVYRMSSITMRRSVLGEWGSILGRRHGLSIEKVKASIGLPILPEGQWMGSQGEDMKGGLETC